MESPYRAAEDTYMVTTNFPAGNFGILPINWYLVEAQEPILVDTGMRVEQKEFMPTLRSLIDPQEIRWIFLTHDDNDHAGSLGQMLEAAPNARLVTNFIGFARLADSWEIPMDRLLLVNPGQSFSAGDRELTVLRPPIWDSPATHGFYDSKTGVLFSADAFGGFVPSPAQDVADVPETDYAHGFLTFARALSPWMTLVDQRKFDSTLEEIRRLGPSTILSSHGPVARGRTETHIRALSTVPSMEPFVGPDQAAMEALMATVEAGGVPTPA